MKKNRIRMTRRHDRRWIAGIGAILCWIMLFILQKSRTPVWASSVGSAGNEETAEYLLASVWELSPLQTMVIIIGTAIVMLFVGILASSAVRSSYMKRMRETERFMNIALNQKQVFLFRYDIAEHILYKESKTGEEYFAGRTVWRNFPEDMTQEPYTHEEDREMLRGVYEALLAGQPEVDAVVRKLDQNGEIWWARINFTTVFNEEQQPVVAVGTYEDITRKIQDERQYLSMVNFRTHEDDHIELTARVNFTTGKVIQIQTDATAVTDRMEGEGYEAFLQAITSFFTERADAEVFGREMGAERMIRRFEHGVFTYTHVHLMDGYADRSFWINTQVNVLRNPLTGEIEGVIYDYNITPKKLYRDLMEGVIYHEFDDIAIVDYNRKIITSLEHPFSDERFAGVKEDTDYAWFCEEYCKRVVAPEYREEFLEKTRLDYVKDQVLQNGNMFYVMTVEQEGKQRRKHVEFFMLHESMHMLGVTLADVTEDYEAEQSRNHMLIEALHEAELANHAKADFFSRMSHDIRTPMNAILGLAKLVLRNTEMTEQNKEQLRKIESTGEYLLNLINDILDMSKIESQKMSLHLRPVQIGESIRKIWDIMQQNIMEKRLRFYYDPAPICRTSVIADEMRLQQVLMNLISNAVKFTPIGGMVGVEVRENDRMEDRVLVEIKVWDTGIGMSEEFLQHLFEPFVQEDSAVSRNYVGTGLGLAIVKHLTELMGGSVTVESEENKGTAFILKIPFELAQNAESTEARIKEESVDLTDLRVLVAEDNDINYEIAAAFLEEKGMLPEWAANGREAVDKVLDHPAGYYDVILMDIRMPELDGIEAVKILRGQDREDLKTIPILAMTANAFEEDVQESLRAGMNAHLTKPIDEEVLFKTIARQLSAASSAKE